MVTWKRLSNSGRLQAAFNSFNFKIEGKGGFCTARHFFLTIRNHHAEVILLFSKMRDAKAWVEELCSGGARITLANIGPAYI